MDRITYIDAQNNAHVSKDYQLNEDNDSYGNECYSGELVEALALYEELQEEGRLSILSEAKKEYYESTISYSEDEYFDGEYDDQEYDYPVGRIL